MRHRYLVAYDVSHPKRLKRTHKTMCGFGDPIQYSIFMCDLERTMMIERLTDVVHTREDRVLILDLGPRSGTWKQRVTYIGQAIEDPEKPKAVVV